jgi:hypothetical protein
VYIDVARSLEVVEIAVLISFAAEIVDLSYILHYSGDYITLEVGS